MEKIRDTLLLIQFYVVNQLWQTEADMKNVVSLLYSVFQKPILAISRKIFFNYEDALDASSDFWADLQENFERVLETYDTSKSFQAWFLTVARNKLLDYGRKIARQQRKSPVTISLDDGYDDDDGNYLETEIVDITAPDPLDEMIHDDEMAIIHNAIAELPKQQNFVFNMIVLEGYSTDEVAKKLAVKPVTVRSHLHAAKRNLRRKLRHLR